MTEKTTPSESPLERFPAILRSIREEQGMGLRELAGKADVTPALISMIERGKIKPSISTLYAIADVLNISVAKLMEEEQQETIPFTVQRVKQRIHVNSNLGRHQYEDAGLVGPRFGTKEIEPSFVRLFKKTFVRQSSSLRGDQLIFCLRGRFGYACDDIVYQLAPGDSLFFDSHIPHGPAEVHTAEADYIVVYVDELYGWLDMRLDFRNSFLHPPRAPEGLTPTQRIAWRIRYARAKRGYQQTYVRALTGFSHGMLSHIESGRAAPSLATVESIARALDVPMAYFFDDTSKIDKAIYIPTDERRYSQLEENGHAYSACPLVKKSFGMPLFKPEYRIYEKQGFVPQKTEKRGQFFVMVIKGSLSFTHGEQTVELNEGDTVYGYSNTLHGVSAVATPRAEVLYVSCNLSRYLSRSLRERYNL